MLSMVRVRVRVRVRGDAIETHLLVVHPGNTFAIMHLWLRCLWFYSCSSLVEFG